MRSAGKYETVIRCLLSDSEQWHTLWNDLDTNLITIKQVLADFKENDSLYTELMDADEIFAGPIGMQGRQVRVSEVKENSPQDTGNNEQPSEGDPPQSQPRKHQPSRSEDKKAETSKPAPAVFRSEDLKAIKGLATRISLFERRCRASLSILDRETDKMITLVCDSP